MKQDKYTYQHIITIVATMLGVLTASAYDVTVPNADGINIYYSLVDTRQAEVTYASKHAPTPEYAGVIEIPAQIEAGGRTYTVASIGDKAFFGCRALEGVKLPSTIESIGMMAFAWSDAITTIDIPASVREIGANAFEGCYALTDITTSGGKFAANGHALYSDDMLTLLVYPSGLEGTVTVPAGTKHIGDNALSARTWMTEVNLPEGLESIGDNAMYFCNGLDHIDLPATVSHIGRNALNDCLNLEAINVAEGNTAFAGYKGALYDRELTTLLQSPGGTSGPLATAPTLTRVGDMACYRNYALTTVQMPEGATAIGDMAFVDCPRLATVELPSTTTHIGDMAFGLCSGLQSMYVRVMDPIDIEMGEDVFALNDLSQATLYVPGESCNLYVHDIQWRQFGHILPIDGLLSQEIEWTVGTETVEPVTRIRLDARSTSGLPVEYILSPSAAERTVIDGDMLEVIAPGKITVTAYQNGNSEYLPATPLTVTLAPPSGIDDVAVDLSAIRVYGGIGVITIKGADPEETASVYDIQGYTLYRGLSRDIPVPSGRIYIVRIGTRSYKVAVR